MTRAEHFCRSAPTWMLRMILRLPSWRDWWTAAWLELFQREVVEVVEETANDESGPWPCVMPKGMH